MMLCSCSNGLFVMLYVGPHPLLIVCIEVMYHISCILLGSGRYLQKSRWPHKLPLTTVLPLPQLVRRIPPGLIVPFTLLEWGGRRKFQRPPRPGTLETGKILPEAPDPATSWPPASATPWLPPSYPARQLWRASRATPVPAWEHCGFALQGNWLYWRNG
jgi:hypothetical protein